LTRVNGRDTTAVLPLLAGAANPVARKATTTVIAKEIRAIVLDIGVLELAFY
jgi:hypothetical protein